MKKALVTIIKVFMFFMVWVLFVSFIPMPNIEDPAIWRFVAEFIPFLCIVGISILFWLIEKRKVQIISFSDCSKNLFVGIIGGGV